MAPSRSELARTLAADGLRVRGGFAPGAADGLPPLPDGQAPAVVWMVGQVGSEAWPHFSGSSFFRDRLPDPMDRWSKSIGDALACDLRGIAIYPSDGPPWFPFQQWAQRAEPVRASPLMLMIHPEFGLWHAYRFALVLPGVVAQDLAANAAWGSVPPDICQRCDGQPCLTTCPVQAFSVAGYHVDACASHLRQPDGQPCMESGCQARLACPMGAGYRYVPQHAAFHMAAFRAARHSGKG